MKVEGAAAASAGEGAHEAAAMVSSVQQRFFVRAPEHSPWEGVMVGKWKQCLLVSVFYCFRFGKCCI